MKSSFLLACTASVLTFLTAPTLAHIGLGYPPAQGGVGAGRRAERGFTSWIGLNKKPFPCGGYKKGPVTTLTAGQVLNVRFWHTSIGKDVSKFPPPKTFKESARHGGGACEFSLSYDGGKSFWVIGQYSQTCPDVFHEWPVKIPKNIKSCTDSNKCLFSWSWIGANVLQFYQNCANVVINGSPNGQVPNLPMTIVDVTARGQKMDTKADNGRLGPIGPSKSEVDFNLKDQYLTPKFKGINLKLIKRR
ncbi:hypothetical protein BGX34_006095 [Mortierella sp. NVP85]|nr:hypothetical protein BGX34_006095 [Mortierella sp. NVP85]